MFDKLKNEVKVYADAVTDAKLKFNQEKEKIDKNFIGGMWAEEYAKIKEEYENTIENLRTSFNASTERTFAEIRNSVKSVVTANISTDAIAELNLIKDMELTAFEIKGYLEKYSNSPKAMKIIAYIAKKNGMKIDYVTSDDVLLAIDELQEKIQRYKETYKGDFHKISALEPLYTNELLVAGTPIDVAESVYNEFMHPTIL